MVTFDAKNIRLGVEADSRDDCIRKICAVMAENGYVGNDYADAVIERENEFPTGLPTEGTLVAIPHSNKGTVFHTGVGVAVLKSPVGFKNMVDPDSILMVEIVFVLCNSDPDKQLDDLRSLMDCLSEAELLKNIRNSKSEAEVADLLQSCEPE